VLPGQQVAPETPHSTHELPEHVPPFEHGLPAAMHVPPPALSQQPAAQVSPAQHGSPGPPQVRQVPPVHAVPAAVQVSPAQQVSPAPPQR
jgi:hypothetical protein